MDVLVQKFGGTSVATPSHIERCAKRIVRSIEDGAAPIAVVSAMAGVTNRLMRLANDITPDVDRRELDRMLVTGEQVSASLLAMSLRRQGVEAVSVDPRDIGILAEPAFLGARVTSVDVRGLRAMIETGRVPVVPGFQAMSAGGDVVTIGRGGSDTTATLLAGAWRQSIGEATCEINTDVLGVHSADPNIVPDAVRLDWLSHDAMRDLAYAGARVVNHDAVMHAARTGVRIFVRHAHLGGSGTWVTARDDAASLPCAVVTLARDVVEWSIASFEDERRSALHEALSQRGITPIAMRHERSTSTLRFICRELENPGVARALRETHAGLGLRDVSMSPALAAITVTWPGARTASDDVAIDRAFQRLWTTPRATYGGECVRTDLVDAAHAEDMVRAIHDVIVRQSASSALRHDVTATRRSRA